MWHGVAEQAVPHSIKIGIKIGRDTLGVRIPAPGQTSQPRVPVPGRYIPITSGCENQWDLGWQKKLQDSQEAPLKGPAVDLGLKQTHSPLELGRRATAGRAPVA